MCGPKIRKEYIVYMVPENVSNLWDMKKLFLARDGCPKSVCMWNNFARSTDKIALEI